jgi:hypothetical protein
VAAPIDLVRRLLIRAGLDGHTVVPVGTVRAALRGWGVASPDMAVEQAVRSGRVCADDAGLGLAEVGQVEQQLAQAVAGLVAPSPPRLRLVAGPRGPAREQALATLAAPVPRPPRVVADAELMGLREWAELLAGAADEPELTVLAAGDPSALRHGGRPAAGAVFADLVASGVVPVHTVGRDLPDHPTALGRLDEALRAGRLPALDPRDHDLVVVPVEGPDAVRHRVDQLVGVSIPRAYGLGPQGIAVLTVREHGPAGAGALAGVCAGRCECRCVAQASARRWPAVVLVLAAEAAGSVTVPLLTTAVGAAQRHLSVVTGLGAHLPRLVAAGPPPAPRTRLPGLLRARTQALTDPAVMPPTM